jgi:hypothetical protein
MNMYAIMNNSELSWLNVEKMSRDRTDQLVNISDVFVFDEGPTLLTKVAVSRLNSSAAKCQEHMRMGPLSKSVALPSP